MKIFGFNLNLNFGRRPGARIKTEAQAPQIIRRSAPYSAEDWLQGRDLDRPILTNVYQQSAWVYRAINVLAEQVANIPFLFSAGDRGRETLITTGPLVNFYDRPHPHINLATVTYLFEGEFLHRDTLGNEQIIRPGAINWMTAGRGIAHAERTAAAMRAVGGRLAGIQS